MVRALVVAAVVLLTAAAPATAHKTCRLGYLTIATSITSLHASHVSCSTARSLADQARHGLYRRRPSRRLPRSFRPRGAAGPWRLRYRTLRYYNKQPTVRVRVTMTRGSRSVVFVAWVDSDKAPPLRRAVRARPRGSRRHPDHAATATWRATRSSS